MTVSHRDYYYSRNPTTCGLFLTEDAMRDTWKVMQEARQCGRRAEAELWKSSLYSLRDIRRALLGRDRRP